MKRLRTIGVLGGMSWESTAVYYRRLNELVQAELGGVTSATVILHSFDFSRIEALQHAEQWDQLRRILGGAGRALHAAGAEFLLIATNTMHILAQEIEADAGIPVLHIADAVAAEISRGGYGRVALLGTRFTMERAFYAERLTQMSGAECITPEEEERAAIHRIIYGELCAGEIRETSRAAVATLIRRLEERGAEAVILGCTELPLLVTEDDLSIPALDTTELHVQAAVRRAIG